MCERNTEMSDTPDDDLDFPTSNMFIDVSNDMFVGRHEEIKLLEEHLSESRIAAISGIGGVGKTTCSCFYAYNNYQKYQNGIFFVDASRLKMLPFRFAEIAGPDVLDVCSAGDSIQDKMKAVSDWLKANSNYLLIYDSADDPDIIVELFNQQEGDVRYIPSTITGHVIISSRCPDEAFECVGLSNLIYLKDFTVKETCEFLWKRVEGEGDISPDEMKILREIAEEALDSRLPLLLEQSGSYIRDKNLSFADYLTVLKGKSERKPVGTADFGDNRQCLDERFTDNFEHLEEKDTNALIMLELASFCDSRNIPLALFSCGAKIIQKFKMVLDDRTKSFVHYILKNISIDVPSGTNELMHALLNGTDIVKTIARLPAKSQLAILSKESPHFYMHAVIQEQLRLKLKQNNNHVKIMKTVGTILLGTLTQDGIPLQQKQMFLAHADKCADFVYTFGDLQHPSDDILDLYVNLKLKVAYIFGWFGLFKTSWQIIADVQIVIPAKGFDRLWLLYFSMKARMYVWQIEGKKSLEAAKQGLEYFEKSLDPSSDVELNYMYAVLQKTCHHAQIHEYRAFSADNADIPQYFTESKRAFEEVMSLSTRECDVEYGSLLMHHGEYYMYKAYKLKNRFELCREYLQARYWLKEAASCFKPRSQIGQICNVLIIEVDQALKHITPDEAVAELGKCRNIAEDCFGKNHRFTAWMVEKQADMMEEAGCYKQCLEYLTEKMERQKRFYGDNEGNFGFGETYHRLGRLYLKTDQRTAAIKALQEAESYLVGTREKQRLEDVRKLIAEVTAGSP